MKKIQVFLFLFLCNIIFCGEYETLTNSSDFPLQVSRGKIISVKSIDKFGANRSIDTTSDPEDIWSFGGLYTFSNIISVDPFVADANITSISSSSTLDTQNVTVYGLDENGYELEQTINLAGQSEVTFNTPYWRIFRVVNNGSGNIQGQSDENINGTVYVYTDDASVTLGVPSPNNTIRATMGAENQTLMAIYTIPRGYTGYLWKGIVGIDRAQSTGVAVFQYLSRRVGKIFNIKYEGSVSAGGNSYFKDVRSFPDPIPELTDILIRVSEVSDNNMGAFASFDILLEKN